MTEATGISATIETAVAVKNAVVCSTVAAGLTEGAWLARPVDGEPMPAQVTAMADGSLLVGVHVASLDAGEAVSVTLEPAHGDAGGRGIEVVDQPENGRLVVNYSGFLQTIYHYGAENFKPRFYPVTAPCARLGPIDGDETVYPKSITQDSPPDHIWHRSLWYACGDVNGVDFYLENGGEGRTVHREFSDVFSGPLFGGFRERLEWVTPDGRTLIDDRRSFTMYRLKGQLRVFDIEAEFTAREESATFGQTNENALPLLRVADVIDEWDGGTITLSTGQAGGRAAFGQRAAWADCSGPLVNLPGRDAEWYGVAMLDHPSNRNHPNAWFARSYGPLGTNLPFFDGPLTLDPGEKWSLKHRVVVHAGDAESAGLQEQWEQYGHAPLLTIG